MTQKNKELGYLNDIWHCSNCGRISTRLKSFTYNKGFDSFFCDEECEEEYKKHKEQLIATPLNSKGSQEANSLNISLKESSHEDSQISSNDETSLNNNIKLNSVPNLLGGVQLNSGGLK